MIRRLDKGKEIRRGMKDIGTENERKKCDK